MSGNEKRDVLRQADTLGLRLLEQDRDPHFKLWRLDCDRKPPAEARDQPVLDSGDFLRVGIAGNDYLLVRFDQRVEGVEKFLLGAVLAAEKLDIVDQQKVQRVVVLLEAVEGLVLIGANHIGNVPLGVDITDLGGRVEFEQQVTDGLNEVSFTQAHTTINK